jgi:predicted kinase
VVLVGPAGAGKTTFAAAHFAPSEILSSDFFRALVSDDETDMRASAPAFAVVRFLVSRRLRRGRRTCVDATNVNRRERLPLVRAAARHGRPAIAVLFDLPLETCLERNRSRPGRKVPEAVIAAQWTAMPRTGATLLAEGFAAVELVSD